MALTVRPCVVCFTPMQTKRSSKQTCSERCTKALYRSKQREQAVDTSIKTEETTQRGNTTMSTQSQAPMQFVFQESEYQSRCKEAKAKYENNIESPTKHVKGRIVEMQFPGDTFATVFEKYHELRIAGYGILDPLAALSSVFVDHVQIITLYMLKPEAVQETELESIYADVRVEYQAELDRGLEAEVERQVQLVLAQQDRAREQAAAQERQQREQEVRDELAASRAKLRDQLIGSGKLNADGSAA